jgi:chromosome segregation ATPase
MSHCPKHKDAPDVTSCRLCASWQNWEKEKKRLALQRERFDLDMQLLKAEKKNHRRSAQVAAQSQSASLAKNEIQLQQQKARQAKQMDELQVNLKKEQEDHRIQVLEWKLQFRKQETEIQEHAEQLASIQETHQAAMLQSKEEQRKEIEMRLQDNNEAHLRQLREREEEKDALQKQNILLTARIAKHAAQQDTLDELQDELTQVKFEKENYAGQVQDLEERCQTMEEEHEAALLMAAETACNGLDSAAPVAFKSSPDVGDCSNCEDLEEEIYKLKLKMNQRRIEHEKETKKLEEELKEGDKAERTIETVGTAVAASAATNTSMSAKEQQELRKIEVDNKRKVESKFLALEARQKATEREKEVVEEDLEQAKAETYQLALELDALQKEFEAQKRQQVHFDEESFLKLKEQIAALQNQQETYVSQQQADSIELNELIDNLGQKQRQVFDATLPAMETKMKAIEEQIDELADMEIAAAAAAAPAVKPPPPEPDHRHIRRVSERQPPLTKVDSRKNRHVTEYDYVNDKQKGKYTGFLNMQNLPEGHGILRVDNGDVYEGEWENGQRHGQGGKLLCFFDVCVAS